MDSLPPLTAIRAFDSAARLGSFAKAAAELHVTHRAIGKQIRVLEDWMGLPMFRRLPQFQQQFPNVTVRISTTSRKLRFIGSASDLGIRLSPDPKLGSAKLMTDRRLPACTPELLRARPIASVQDLRGHTLLHSATTSSAWSEWLTLAGAPHLKPVQHMEFEHVHLQLEAALNGLGVALASLPLIQADLAGGRLICPISKPEWSAQDYLLLSEHQEEDAAVRAFRSWILDTARATVR